MPVGQVVIDELAAHLAAYPTDGPLFVDELGEPLQYWRWKKILAPATEAAGVELTAHGLRHFFASAAHRPGSVGQAGADGAWALVLGHHAADTYTHLWPGDEDRTRDVLDAALSPLADSLRTEAASSE